MKQEDIVIAGYGGFAREVQWLIERINLVEKRWNFKGFIDCDNSENPLIIGDDSYIIDTKDSLNVVIAVGSVSLRKKLYDKYKTNKNIKFPNLIDPSVIFSKDISMGEGNIICAGNILTVNIQVGNCCIVNLHCTIGHDSCLEDFITINPNSNVSGNVSIHSCTEIGTGSKIIQGVSIGCNSILGAGAVVVRDVQENTTSVGVPAKVVKFH